MGKDALRIPVVTPSSHGGLPCCTPKYTYRHIPDIPLCKRIQQPSPPKPEDLLSSRLLGEGRHHDFPGPDLGCPDPVQPELSPSPRGAAEGCPLLFVGERSAAQLPSGSASTTAEALAMVMVVVGPGSHRSPCTDPRPLPSIIPTTGQPLAWALPSTHFSPVPPLSTPSPPPPHSA